MTVSSFSASAAPASDGSEQARPACPMVRRNSLRLQDFTPAGISKIARPDNFVSIHLAMELEGIDHVALGVRDVEAAAKWYTELLGFERRYDDVWEGYPVFVVKGTTGLALFPAEANARSLAAVASA